MNLIRYNPNSLDLLDNVSRWFDDFFVEPTLGRSILPAVDVRETDPTTSWRWSCPVSPRRTSR